MMRAVTLTIRPRRDDDLTALGRALVEQQSASGYPHREPLPMPAEEFIARPGSLAAWTAEVDGQPVGHIAVLPVSADGREPELARLWSAGHGLPAERLGEVGVYFTASHVRGTGVGSALLRTALADLADRGLAPCLDVVPTGAAVEVYRRAGWIEVGSTRPSWLSAGAPDVIAMILATDRGDAGTPRPPGGTRAPR